MLLAGSGTVEPYIAVAKVNGVSGEEHAFRALTESLYEVREARIGSDGVAAYSVNGIMATAVRL